MYPIITIFVTIITTIKPSTPGNFLAISVLKNILMFILPIKSNFLLIFIKDRNH